MRSPPVRSLLLVAVVVVSVSVAPVAGVVGESHAQPAPADRVPPRPVVVSEVDDPPEGELVVEPAQVGVTLDPAFADLADLRVTNGSELAVSLDVEVLPVGAAADGAPVVPAEAEPVPSAADWIELPARQVHLGPSEAAAFQPAVAVPDGAAAGGYVAAIRFRGTDPGDADEEDATPDDADGDAAPDDADGDAAPDDAPQVTAFVLVQVPGSEDAAREAAVEVSLARVDRTSAAATATFDAGVAGAVDLTADLRVRSWYGTTVIDTRIPSTLVLPTVPRERTVGFRAPVLPGPYRAVVEDVTAPGLQVAPASARAWLWNPGAVIVLAIALLLLTSWLLYRTARRAR